MVDFCLDFSLEEIGMRIINCFGDQERLHQKITREREREREREIGREREREK